MLTPHVIQINRPGMQPPRVMIDRRALALRTAAEPRLVRPAHAPKHS